MLMDATAIVESYIDNADFDVATFAREMCMSRTLLFTKLKALTGQTPNDFILSLRLKKATEKLINDPNAPIADIAFDYGFLIQVILSDVLRMLMILLRLLTGGNTQTLNI